MQVVKGGRDVKWTVSDRMKSIVFAVQAVVLALDTQERRE